ncbi:hypothetical protein AMAG_08280 [Allomyces macrogynus ATCC 38327]|uniref:FH2 domain-containing protein n=1 Tax=Allomyces macrogynus (strain ATCC 38327) TaxID=578462 RepID=A0A0L0SL59_ALLM3|nr:hypothetical protein AMAG_08280 [Allomyces macrogynus ATCC 38327]|eukprot:KNE63115.1 hypothetical protein AMAG_08280 [Allomyces macrogynus ATCC 38327]
MSSVSMPDLGGVAGANGDFHADPGMPSPAALVDKRSSVIALLPPGTLEAPNPPKDSALFERLVNEMLDDMGLKDAARRAVYTLPDRTRWTMVQQHYTTRDNRAGVQSNNQYSPDHYLKYLPPQADRVSHKLLMSLRISLVTHTPQWIAEFVQLGGLRALVMVHQRCHVQPPEVKVQPKFLVIEERGRLVPQGPDERQARHDRALAMPEAIESLCLSLDSANPHTRNSCRPGHAGTRSCSRGSRHSDRERDAPKRFYPWLTTFMEVIQGRGIMGSLVGASGPTRGMTDDELNEYALSNLILINGLVRIPQDFAFRLHLRNELLACGLQQALTTIQSFANDFCKWQITQFHDDLRADMDEFADRCDVVVNDFSDPMDLFKGLLQSVEGHSEAMYWLTTLLQHLACIRGADEDSDETSWQADVKARYLRFIDTAVAEIVLDGKGIDPDFSSRHTVNAHLHDEQASHQATIARQDRDVQQLLLALRKDTADRLLKAVDAGSHQAQAKLEQQVDDLAARIKSLEAELDVWKCKAAEGVSALAGGPALAAPTGAAPPPPPPPPPPALVKVLLNKPQSITPAKLWSFLQKIKLSRDVTVLENLRDGMPRRVRKYAPAVTLKQLQWEKIPDIRIRQTIWAPALEAVEKGEDPDEKWAKTLGDTLFAEMQAVFPARQAKVIAPAAEAAAHAVKKEISVLDSKRAYNINLMLAKLKKPFAELRRAILRMDFSVLTLQTVSQFLKFAPTAEELGRLQQYKDDPSELANADRFMVEMMRIDRYEPRLKAMDYYLRFDERVRDQGNDVHAVLDAAQALIDSKAFHEVLQLILTMGNYMNTGFRGNAYGFRINSINKLVDTKSADNKRTLLHFLVETVTNKVPNLLAFTDDLKDMTQACRVSFEPLTMEMNALNAGLRDIDNELDRVRKEHPEMVERAKERIAAAKANGGTAPSPAPASGESDAGSDVGSSAGSSKDSDDDDRFYDIMSVFSAQANDKLKKLFAEYNAMKVNYEQVVAKYGEDPSAMGAEEFFGIFKTFLTAFERAHKEIIAQHEQKERQERRRRTALSMMIPRRGASAAPAAEGTDPRVSSLLAARSRRRETLNLGKRKDALSGINERAQELLTQLRTMS